jgi:hypothetical protein
MATKFQTLGRDVFTTNLTVEATGNSQATAKLLSASTNVVTASTATTGIGLRLPAQWTPGDRMYVANVTGNALSVYPPAGKKVNGGTDNAAVTLKANAMAVFLSVGGDNWAVVLDS